MYAAMAELIDDKMLTTLAGHGTPEDAPPRSSIGSVPTATACAATCRRYPIRDGTSPISSRRCGADAVNDVLIEIDGGVAVSHAQSAGGAQRVHR